MDKGGLSPIKGEGFATHAPHLPYKRAMKGCGGEQGNPLSEPNKVEEKERKKKERKGPRPRERERRRRERKKKEEEGRRGAPHDAVFGLRELEEAQQGM